MAKSQDAFRTIGEVAEWLGAPTHALRFWESRFTQIRPIKGDGGSRFYRPSDMALLGGIKKLLQEEGLTIGGVQALLRERGVPYVAALSPPLDSPARRANGTLVANRNGEAEVEEQESEQDDGARNVLVLEPAMKDSDDSRILDSASPCSDGNCLADAESERTTGIEGETEPDGNVDNVLLLSREPANMGGSQTSLPLDDGESARTGTEPASSLSDFPEPGEDDAPGSRVSGYGETQSSEFGDDGSGGDGESPEPDTVPQTPVPAEATPEVPHDIGDWERSPYAAEVLALLRNGGWADSEELRPLYDRLRNLRERIVLD